MNFKLFKKLILLKLIRVGYFMKQILNFRIQIWLNFNKTHSKNFNKIYNYTTKIILAAIFYKAGSK
jgi:hypothetical protein